VTSPGEDTSAARPALATAGGLLVALALLQIAQQVVGVFNPRASIQATLIVAVGLAALAVERKRDRIGIAAAGGAVLALTATAAIWATSGFSTPQQPSLETQVDRIRAGLRDGGAKVVYRRLRLRPSPPAPTSHVFVVSRPGRSDEVRIYDPVDGALRRRLAFRPEIRFPESERTFPTRFVIRSVRDLDGDGQREILAHWEANQAGEEFQRAPVLLSRSSKSGRYAVRPLLPVAQLREAADGLPALRFDDADVVWVSDYGLDEEHFVPGAATLVTRTVGSDPHHLGVAVAHRFPPTVRFWDVARGRARCVRGGARRVADTPSLGKGLADAMADAGLFVGDYVDGRCVEAAS
jgi:hypothetical protein